MSAADEGDAHLAAVGLFPLPNVVLFPRAVLPLHIFEERYKTMVADTLRSDRQIAMALLKPGWERDYYSSPSIEPVVCVGTVLSHERLPDGEYNLLLQGQMRARIVREHVGIGVSYRVAQLRALATVPVLEIDLASERERLAALFANSILATTGLGRQFSQILSGTMPTADVADLIAYNFLDDVHLKQSLLEDADDRHRVVRTIDALEALCPLMQAAARRRNSPNEGVN